MANPNRSKLLSRGRTTTHCQNRPSFLPSLISFLHQHLRTCFSKCFFVFWKSGFSFNFFLFISCFLSSVISSIAASLCGGLFIFNLSADSVCFFKSGRCNKKCNTLEKHPYPSPENGCHQFYYLYFVHSWIPKASLCSTLIRNVIMNCITRTAKQTQKTILHPSMESANVLLEIR